eukprot:SAG31_NODE_42055_length_273_cov_0.718391_1_plen_52_part_01
MRRFERNVGEVGRLALQEHLTQMHQRSTRRLITSPVSPNHTQHVDRRLQARE